MSSTAESIDRGTDQIADLFYPLYEWAFSGKTDFVSDMDRKLAEARMNETVELFLSRAIGYGAVSGLVLWIIGTLLGYLLFATGIVHVGSLIGLPVPNETLFAALEFLKIPALVVVTGIVFGAIGFAIGFGGLVAIPYTRASSRKREINMLLPDAVSFMFALSTGGLNQLEILESMAKADDVYGEVALEFRSIVQETKYFDVDYRTAIRNRALETPSDELSQFLTDMLSIINSGGDMTNFLEDKKNRHMRTAKQEQETTLETLELFGEMYMTLSLFPLLLIIVIVIMSMLGQADQMILYATIYGLIPGVGVGFLVLVSTVKQDEPGDGYLRLANERNPGDKEPGLLDMGIVEDFVGEWSIFSRIKNREGTYKTAQLLRNPHHFFKDTPLFTLGLTVPTTLALLIAAFRAGVAPTSFAGMVDNPIYSTVLYAYLPLYVIGLPLAIFYEWNVYSRHLVIDKLSENLRKLSSANDTGLTLLEAMRTVADTSRGKLGEEFAQIHAKVNYGTSLNEALVEFNNKYHIPRLSRTVNLVSKAQEASSQISAVLTTAAQASENQDDIDRERKSRTRMQVVIIIMTYLTLLAVMAILKVSFLDVMAGLSTQTGGGGGAAAGGVSFGGSIDIQLLTMLFFHAVTIQGILAGFIAGYIRDARILSGVKFAIVLPTIALAVFAFI
ncbi:Pilus assembly protein TadC [Halanaeroarchaeum sp. HSR-CO]|uniref:type II secretion system F family protein n=1 Tax=Halanaeroarchaeum sp. HSR-CO TaxID=2866382 RepID=UPI00217D9A62|nr:type II secretion system F family protein [Halanaeroarchaeum sp. HSR-CO]UWG47719.1 Pilus assembly protein TadC [Halanaeroarchaeum sp. HSR-CO]